MNRELKINVQQHSPYFSLCKMMKIQLFLPRTPGLVNTFGIAQKYSKG